MKSNRKPFAILILAFVFFYIFYPLHSQQKRPFWDKWETNFSIFLPATQYEICIARSDVRITFLNNFLECKNFEPEKFMSILSDLILEGDKFKEIKIVILKKGQTTSTVQVKIEEKSYRFLSLIFNKNLSAYYIELIDSEKKYYIFLIDPSKISFPAE